MRELRTTDKVIITVSPTGGFQGKEANPNLPITPEEIAQATYECWNEGAAIVHIHAREPGTNKATSDPDILRDIDQRIREKCDIILQHSTAADFMPPGMNPQRFPSDKRIRAIEMNPEMASLSVLFSRLGIWKGQEQFKVTYPHDIEYGARAMLERGIKPELEIYNPVSMEDVYHLIDRELIKAPYWIDFVFGMTINQGFMSYSPRYLMWLVDLLPLNSMFNVVGVGASQVHVTTLSILLGGHIRVGFEDNIYYRRGQLAVSNAQLVSRAVLIARELGCEIATPNEARQMLGVPELRH
ncbi:3-keto-5-aminohexanoate cleavage protein [Chloroflexota bacterium]